MATPSTRLLADLTGSVALFTQLEQADAVAVQKCYSDVMRGVLQEYGGQIDTSSGDEVLGTFPDARSACVAAVQLQRRLQELPTVESLALNVRIGLIVGEQEHSPADQLLELTGVTLQAHPGEIVLSHRVREFAWGLPESCGHFTRFAPAHPLFRLEWQVHPVSPTVYLAMPRQGPRLRLNHGGQEYWLSPQQPRLELGRDAQSGLRLSDRKVSRQHAHIVWQGGYFLFRDHSSNGSYIVFQNQAEYPVKHDEFRLSGEGRIYLGSASAQTGGELLEFEVSYIS